MSLALTYKDIAIHIELNLVAQNYSLGQLDNRILDIYFEKT